MESRHINWRMKLAIGLAVISIIFSFFPVLSSCAFASFLLAMLTFLYDQDLKIQEKLDNTESKSVEMSNDVKKHLKVISLDTTAKTFDDYVIKRLNIIESIKNTSFNLPKSHEDADDKFNKTKEVIDAPFMVKECIANGLKWRDIGDTIAQIAFSAGRKYVMKNVKKTKLVRILFQLLIIIM